MELFVALIKDTIIQQARVNLALMDVHLVSTTALLVFLATLDSLFKSMELAVLSIMYFTVAAVKECVKSVIVIAAILIL